MKKLGFLKALFTAKYWQVVDPQIDSFAYQLLGKVPYLQLGVNVQKIKAEGLVPEQFEEVIFPKAIIVIKEGLLYKIPNDDIYLDKPLHYSGTQFDHLYEPRFNKYLNEYLYKGYFFTSILVFILRLQVKTKVVKKKSLKTSMKGSTISIQDIILKNTELKTKDLKKDLPFLFV